MCTRRLRGHAEHASSCNVGEATRGHNAVRVLLYDFSLAAGDAIEKEPHGCPGADDAASPRALRPADVPCHRFPAGRAAALDIGIGITTADVAGGGNAADAMNQGKSGAHEPFVDELAAQNV